MTKRLIPWLCLLAAPAAGAHPLAMHGAGFAAGIAHPFLGLDHVLAMIAVGIWAAQLNRRATWAVPLAFIVTMIVAALTGASGMSLPHIEIGIAASVLVLGLLIAGAARVPTFIGMLLVSVFAIFHGHSHGTELPLAASPALYGLGFVTATALLHGLGIALGLSLQRAELARFVRLGGVAIAAAGVLLWSGA